MMALPFAAAIFGGCATHRMDQRPVCSTTATGFLIKTMAVENRQRPYVVYVPREYDPGRQWPLIVFLHGIGERGDDGLLQTEVGIGRAIRRHARRFACLVLMPQCPEDRMWGDATTDIETAMAQTRDEYNIDPSRIYLTGLSMGGFGTWLYGAAHVETFAALMPICGGGNPDDAEKLATIPIWAFHGADDPRVDARRSRQMVDAVKKAKGTIRYTEYPGVEHNSWDQAYDDPKAIRWLLKQRKRN